MPPTSEEAVCRLEQRLGFGLPTDYRDFLLRYNGGGPDEKNYCFQSSTEREEPYLITLFFPVEGRIDIFSQWRAFQGRVPWNLLPIGSDDSGNLFCLGAAGPKRGFIFFWDHEAERGAFDLVGEPVPGEASQPLTKSNETEYWGNISLVAKSFADFLNGLGEYPDEAD